MDHEFVSKLSSINTGESMYNIITVFVFLKIITMSINLIFFNNNITDFLKETYIQQTFQVQTFWKMFFVSKGK